jgi:hypothetical protein
MPSTPERLEDLLERLWDEDPDVRRAAAEALVGRPFSRTRKPIKDVRPLRNRWVLLKTQDSKSAGDFRVITVYQTKPLRYYTPKHAHFAIDLYGKWCKDPQGAGAVFSAIVDLWQGQSVTHLTKCYGQQAQGLPGYELEYILYALEWILEQEDINFRGRPPALQERLNAEFQSARVQVPPGREGSQLAMVLLLQVAKGKHPVEAMLAANLDVLPIKRGRRVP